MRWHIGLSIRYHMRRVAFFDAYNMWTNVLGVLFGSATVVTIFKELGHGWIMTTAFLITILFTIDLVVGSNRKSRQHHDLARRFIEIEQQAELDGLDDPQKISNIRIKMLAAEKDEPPILQALNDLCYNEMVLAEGHESTKLLPLPWYKRRMAHFISFEPHN